MAVICICVSAGGVLDAGDKQEGLDKGNTGWRQGKTCETGWGWGWGWGWLY